MSTPERLLDDTASLGGQTFTCRYDEFTGVVYTYAVLSFVVGDVLDLPGDRLSILGIERQGGVTRIKTRPLPPAR